MFAPPAAPPAGAAVGEASGGGARLAAAPPLGVTRGKEPDVELAGKGGGGLLLEDGMAWENELGRVDGADEPVGDCAGGDADDGEVGAGAADADAASANSRFRANFAINSDCPPVGKIDAPRKERMG